MSMFPSVASNTTDLATMAGQSKVAQTQSGQGGKSFIRFDHKTGAFTHGVDKEDITNELLAVNIKTFMHGFTLWHMQKPTKLEVSFTEDLPLPMESKTTPKGKVDRPEESRSFDAAFTDDDATILSFGTSTYGGRKGADAVLDAFLVKADNGEKVYLYPVVELTSESYTSGEWGLIHNPIFKLVDWMAVDGSLESEAKKVEAPKARKKKAAKVEIVEEPEVDEEEEEDEEQQAPAPIKKRRSRSRAA